MINAQGNYILSFIYFFLNIFIDLLLIVIFYLKQSLSNIFSFNFFFRCSEEKNKCSIDVLTRTHTHAHTPKMEHTHKLGENYTIYTLL